VPADTTSVLDVGCGDGASSNGLVDRGLAVVGIDPSPRALRFAAAKPAVALGDRLPFDDRSFDLVLAFEVIEHLPEPVRQRTLAEMARVAHRHILVSTPHREALTRSRARCDSCGATFHSSLHHHAFSAADHRGLFEGSAFEHECSQGILEWRPSEAWARARLLAGGRYALVSAARCPRCGHVNAPTPAPPPARRRALRLVDGLAWRLTRPEPRWMVSRFARRP
jgi:SAM-dependent methyltransferase